MTEHRCIVKLIWPHGNPPF